MQSRQLLISAVVLSLFFQAGIACGAELQDTDVKLRNYPAEKVPDVKSVVDKPIKVHFWTFSVNTLNRLRSDSTFAKRLARYGWLEKSAAANPAIIEAITNHRSAAKILARHPHIAEIAQADPYVCRRISKWPSAARILAANGNAAKAISRDPEGIYRAIRKDRRVARILAKNPMFDQMVYDNPDLGQFISHFM
jgi:hypothetical protein